MVAYLTASFSKSSSCLHYFVNMFCVFLCVYLVLKLMFDIILYALHYVFLTVSVIALRKCSVVFHYIEMIY